MFLHGSHREYGLDPIAGFDEQAQEFANSEVCLPSDHLCQDGDRPEKTAAYLDVVSRLATHITEAANANARPVVVGINGVDTSGKTEFTRTLADLLAAANFPHTLVHTDDFMNNKADRHKGGDEVQNYYDYAIDFGCIRDKILVPARAGRLPSMKRFLHCHPARDDYMLAHTYEFYPSPSAILAEGVFLFRPGLAELFDIKIFLDIPLTKVLERARKRDLEWGGEAVMTKYEKKYIPTQRVYLALAQPAIKADFTIDMSDTSLPLVRKAPDICFKTK